MQDETCLREQAREAVKSGKIPDRAHDRFWGGSGVGIECTVCGRPITTEEMEFKIQFGLMDGGELEAFHVHVRCFAAWEFERNGNGRA
jgi:hypothetical protein